jgi:hypothetical protein
MLWSAGFTDSGEVGTAGVYALTWPWLTLSALGSVLGLVTVITFLQWMHAAYVRASRDVADARFTPGFAVASWFLPVGNFVIPLFTVRHLWQLSRAGVNWRREQPQRYIVAWWGAWAGSLLVSLASVVLSFDYESRSSNSAEMREPLYLALGFLPSLLSLVALVLVLRLVRDITVMQCERLGVD